MKWILSLSLLFSTALSWGATPRTVMVQLFEWPWESIAWECENYLGPNGFSAVQVSPPQEHLVLDGHPWWERYQPVSYKLISRSGNEDQFRQMVQRCARAGVDIYVDVVLNHMAGLADGVGFAGTTYRKYNHTDLYSYSDFHHCGRNGNDQIVNFNDRYEVQNCELLGLADLKTESNKVQAIQASYLHKLIQMGVKGFRIDAAKHIPAQDLISLFSKVPGKPYLISETFIGQGEPVSLEEYQTFSDINFFQYSFDLGSTILRGGFSRLLRAMSHYPDSKDTVIFVENHDLQRISSENLPSLEKTPQAYLLAHVFMLTWPYGYPQIFSGYRFTEYNEGPPVDPQGFSTKVQAPDGTCFAPWSCEHRIGGIATLVQFRNYTNSYFGVTDLWVGTDRQIAFGRSSLGFVVINNSATTLQNKFKTSLPNGQYCNVLGSDYNMQARSCSQGYEVQNGNLSVTMPPGTALVLQKSTLVRQ
ncbi:MAG: alpha-amylase [Oligoflexia bacterium]|nr:MAG: alpha-amylase [Oligoflexia bacterium]